MINSLFISYFIPMKKEEKKSEYEEKPIRKRGCLIYMIFCVIMIPIAIWYHLVIPTFKFIACAIIWYLWWKD